MVSKKLKKVEERTVLFAVFVVLLALALASFSIIDFNPTGFVTEQSGVANESACIELNASYVWYDGICYDGQPVCAEGFLELCLDETNCTEALGYWYDDICNEEPICDAEHLKSCNESECGGLGYWYDANEDGNSTCNEVSECDGEIDASCNTTEGYVGLRNCTDGLWEECLTTEFCGDSIINGNEECDDGNITDGDGCSSQCIIEYCGDGVVNNVSEVCDDGTNDGSYDGCNSDCLSLASYCGDGTCDSNEDCDEDDECEDDCGECDDDDDDDDDSSSSDDENVLQIPTSPTTTTCTPGWECGEWTECIDGTQTRECTDLNACDSEEGKPAISQSCEVAETCFDGIQNQDEKGIDCGGVCEEKCSVFTIVGSAISGSFGSSADFFKDHKGFSFSILGVAVLFVSWMLVAKFAFKEKNLLFFLDKIKFFKKKPNVE